MLLDESTNKESEASTSTESAESKLIIHHWEIYCFDELYVSV